MSVIFTAEAEKRRLEARKNRAKSPVTWELLKTTSLAEAVHFANENGWKEKKVQVKQMQLSNGDLEYLVEPYEKDCMCPNIIQYNDFFDVDPQKSEYDG